jgi:transposase
MTEKQLPIDDIVSSAKEMSAAAIAKKFGTSDSTVRRILKRANVKMTPGRRRDESLLERNQRIYNARKAGSALEDIGHDFSLTKARIGQILNALGGDPYQSV